MTLLRREPVHAIDRDGVAIVAVRLANTSLSACLWAEDFERIAELGFSDQWVFNDSGNGHCYVKVAAWGASGRVLTLARLIANARAGQIVTYADGDRTNLRRDNLIVRRGRSFGREKVAAEERAAMRSPASPTAPCYIAAGAVT